MKRFFLFSVLAVFVLSACAAAESQAVQLPVELSDAIVALSVFAVGWIFTQLGNALPWFAKLFGQYVDEISFALSGAVITLVQSWLNMIPIGWENVGSQALSLIVAILAALQLFRLFGKAGVKTFR